ncbi:phosphotransferase [Sphingomonas radiodurans]|uniref:phosphotransferase n=1 Tax=Sphingomonas radiodurans TaxID=2890321 RepID=UPI001E5481E2|nr:phosphotransferase [Sphingomonas radiodurans]WBH17152.1 phosphotransferase [Sphingomonas radiodurans]
MRALHDLPADECPFDSSVAAWLPEARDRVAAGLVDEDDFDPDHCGWSAKQVLAKVEALAACATGRVVVHGDLSLGNLLFNDAGNVSGCIDAGRLGVADPYQDIAICWRDLGGLGAAAQAMFIAALALNPPDWQRMILHRSLDELF